jgi:large subunit ribosomal protein L19
MLGTLAGAFSRQTLMGHGFRVKLVSPLLASPALSVEAVRCSSTLLNRPEQTVAPDDMPFLHHGKRPRFRDYVKFKSPRKRASKLYSEIVQEAIQKSKEAKPKVWNTPFRVGDAIEIEAVEEGGINATSTEKIRGVVLGIFRKGLDHSVLIRDVVFGEPVETRVPLHSPLLRSVKILENNFVHKGKKKIKRAKLYYLSERNPLGKKAIASTAVGFGKNPFSDHPLTSLSSMQKLG